MKPMKPERVQLGLKAERIQLGLKAERVQVPLKAERIQLELQELPGWEAEGEKSLTKTFLFPTLRAVTLFVSLVVEVGEEIGFVPEIDIRYLEVTLRISTNTEIGLNEVDLEVARFFQFSL